MVRDVEARRGCSASDLVERGGEPPIHDVVVMEQSLWRPAAADEHPSSKALEDPERRFEDIQLAMPEAVVDVGGIDEERGEVEPVVGGASKHGHAAERVGVGERGRYPGAGKRHVPSRGIHAEAIAKQ